MCPILKAAIYKKTLTRFSKSDLECHSPPQHLLQEQQSLPAAVFPTLHIGLKAKKQVRRLFSPLSSLSMAGIIALQRHVKANV